MSESYPVEAPQGEIEPPDSVWNVANIVYGLHSLAIVIGLTGTAWVVGMFLGSLPSIAAVVLNYVMRGDARGSWLESHYRWQIRTFWYTALWALASMLLVLTVVGFPIAVVTFSALTIWVVYRIARGWLRLRDRRPMYD